MESKIYFVDLENTLSEYEIIRTDILKKYEIEYVQQKIKRKILKEESTEIEILFYKDELNNEEIDSSMTSFLTENSNESNNINYNKEINSNESNNINYNKEINSKKKMKFKTKFINIEAECSNEIDLSEEEDETDLEDFIVSNDNEQVVEKELLNFLHINKVKEENKELKFLKEKYLIPKSNKLIKKQEINKFEIETINSDDLEISEIEEFNIEKFELINNYTKIKKENNKNLLLDKNKNIVINNDIKINFDYEIFNNNELALEKLLKREDKYSTGFFEK